MVALIAKDGVSASLPAGVLQSWCSVQSMTCERLDTLPSPELRRFALFPETVQSWVNQSPPTLPISADGEMFSPERIQEFKDSVRIAMAARLPQLGDIQPEIWLARADFRIGNQQFENHPVHTITAFTYNGEKFAGPVIGSFTGQVLRFAHYLEPQEKAEIVCSLVEKLWERPQFSGYAISFAPSQRRDAASGAMILDPELQIRSQALQILTSPRLGFAPFMRAHLMDGSPGNSPDNHIYYWKGDSYHELGCELAQILQIMRELRMAQLKEIRSTPGYDTIFALRDKSRDEFIRSTVGGVPLFYQ